MSRKYRSYFGIIPYVTVLLWSRLKIAWMSEGVYCPCIRLYVLLIIIGPNPVTQFFRNAMRKHFRSGCGICFVLGPTYLSYVEVSSFKIKYNSKFVLNSMISTNANFCCTEIQWNEHLGYTHSQFSSCHVTIDGIDFWIQKPKAFFISTVLTTVSWARRTVQNRISAVNPKIVWVNWAYLCETWCDLGILEQYTCASLQSGESVLANRGYRHVTCITPDGAFPHARLLHGHIWASHETCKERCNNF